MKKALNNRIEEAGVAIVHHGIGDFVKIHLPSAQMIQFPLCDLLVCISSQLVYHNRLFLISNCRRITLLIGGQRVLTRYFIGV